MSNDIEIKIEAVSEHIKKEGARLSELYKKKNKAYGDSFGRSFERYGPIAAVVRMSDKWNRIESLLVDKAPNEVEDESVSDTLSDMACYALMLSWELKNRGKK